MTIAKRLMLLPAVPLLILLGIGLITRRQMARIEERTRFVAESRVVALARLGDNSRSFAELMSRDWMAGAEQAMSLAAADRKDEAYALLSGSLAGLGTKGRPSRQL